MRFPRIEPCGIEHRPAVLSLLATSGLPDAGLSDHWDSAWVALDAANPSGVLGCVALEVYADAALLRSLATREDWRSRGLGTRLFEFAIARATERGLRSVALLTTTAAPFFARRGFDAVSREAVPVSLHASAEFQGACPASAQAMIRRLL